MSGRKKGRDPEVGRATARHRAETASKLGRAEQTATRRAKYAHAARPLQIQPRFHTLLRRWRP
eukprot:6931232-Alexandrium_andersonii.AAC.1